MARGNAHPTGRNRSAPGGERLAAINAPRAPFPVADCNDDMLVTQDDFTLFAGWLDGGDPRADATHDGVVNEADFDYFYAYWTLEMNR